MRAGREKCGVLVRVTRGAGDKESRHRKQTTSWLTCRYISLIAAMPLKASGRVAVSWFVERSRYVRESSWDQAAGSVLLKELPLRSIDCKLCTPDQAAGREPASP